MALDLLYNPGEYFSAHGDLIFTLLEDTKPFSSTLYPDYRYVCDVYIVNGVGVETQVTRLKSHPRPVDKIGVFDVGSIVRNYLSTTFQPHATDIFYQKIGVDAFYVQVICRFGEEYGFVTYSNIIVDSQRSYFNHYNKRLFGSYTTLQSYLDKVISVRPYATSVARTSTHNLIPFLASDDTVIDIEVKCYSRSSGLVRQQDFNITPTASSVDEIEQINIAPACLNFQYPGLIDNAIDYYTVRWNTTNITDDSIFQFNLVCEPKYEVFTIHFLNQFGGFESRDFTKVSRRRIEIEKKDYGSSAYAISSLGQPEYFNAQKVYRETKSVYAGAWKEKMILNTDILTDAEYEWLEDLVLSPLAYIEIDDYFFPITMTDNNYEPKKSVNDDLTNLTINIEYGDRFNTQYR